MSFQVRDPARLVADYADGQVLLRSVQEFSSRITIWNNASMWAVFEPRQLAIARPDKLVLLEAEAIVVAIVVARVRSVRHRLSDIRRCARSHGSCIYGGGSPRYAEADTEAVSRVRIAHAGDSKANRTAGITGNIVVGSAAAHRFQHGT